MDLQDFLKSIGAPASGTTGDIPAQIETLVGDHIQLAGRNPLDSTGRCVECVCAALGPLMGLAPNAEPNDRLLFALVFVGATTTPTENGDNMSFRVEIGPRTVLEAIKTYNKFTGKDISPFLPKSLVDFANNRLRFNS